MTDLEKRIEASLSYVTFLPGSFDKRFVNQLKNWRDREMTEKGRAKLIEIFHKYKRRNPFYYSLKAELENQNNIRE